MSPTPYQSIMWLIFQAQRSKVFIYIYIYIYIYIFHGFKGFCSHQLFTIFGKKNLKGHGFIYFIRMCYFQPSSYWLDGKCKCIMGRFLNFLVFKIQGAYIHHCLLKNSLISLFTCPIDEVAITYKSNVTLFLICLARKEVSFCVNAILLM